MECRRGQVNLALLFFWLVCVVSVVYVVYVVYVIYIVYLAYLGTQLYFIALHAATTLPSPGAVNLDMCEVLGVHLF